MCMCVCGCVCVCVGGGGGPPLAETELLEMIERADTDQDGEISPDEFYAVSARALCGARLSRALVCVCVCVCVWGGGADHDQEDVYMSGVARGARPWCLCV